MQYFLMRFLILFALFFIGCKAPEFAIGMSEREFTKRNKVELVYAAADQTIYKKVNYPFGGAPVVRFFYFQGGKLVRFDQGRREPDVIIEKR